jgi:hypothetical protein
MPLLQHKANQVGICRLHPQGNLRLWPRAAAASSRSCWPALVSALVASSRCSLCCIAW